jgi:hypothetical protein
MGGKMPKSTAKMDVKLQSMVQLLNETEVSALFSTNASEILVNPTVTYVKFTLTDDKVNANRQRIPVSEFQNLIRTGMNMPIKMAIGEISPGHEDTKPLGVMTHLKEIVTEFGNRAIIALAALWTEERPADIQYLKQRFAEGKPIDVSWEILYEDAVMNPEQNSMDLVSTVLKAATIVGNPAYTGRTQFLSVAAKKWSKAYIEELPDEHFLYVDPNGKRHLPIMDAEGKLERVKLQEALAGLGELNLPAPQLEDKKKTISGLLERFDAGASIEAVSNDYYTKPAKISEEPKLDEINELKAKLAEVEAKLDEAIRATEARELAVAEKQTALAELEAKIAALTEEVAAKDGELVSLREFKASLDAASERNDKLTKLKAKFTEAGVNKEDAYFVENEATLFALDDAALNLMIAEAKSAVEGKASVESHSSIQIPALPSDTDEIDYSDMKALAKAMRESKAKK